MNETDPTPILARLRELHEAATPGPWTAYRMIHAEHGGDMSADEMGEYVRNSVLKSAAEGGGPAFLAVLAHVGNGPTSPANAKAIEAMHASHSALLAVAEAAAYLERAEREYPAKYEEARFHNMALLDERAVARRLLRERFTALAQVRLEKAGR